MTDQKSPYLHTGNQNKLIVIGERCGTLSIHLYHRLQIFRVSLRGTLVALR